MKTFWLLKTFSSEQGHVNTLTSLPALFVYVWNDRYEQLLHQLHGSMLDVNCSLLPYPPDQSLSSVTNIFVVVKSLIIEIS